MSNQIKNIFSKLRSGKIQIIKGREGFQTNIKDLYLVNNTEKRVFVDIYFINSKQVKIYFLKNITLPPKIRLDVPNKSNINLSYLECIYVEIADPDIITEVDIFCNYIQTETYIITVGVEFQNQNNKKINDSANISWRTIKSNDLKLIQFTITDKYSSVSDIKYKLDGNNLTVFKNTNLKPPKYKHVEYYDRYELNIIDISKNEIYDSIKSYIRVSFNIISSPIRDPKWRISQDEIFTDEIEWKEPYTLYDTFESDFYLNFSEVENYIKPLNDSIKISKNTQLELEYKYRPSQGLLKIRTDYIVNNLRWNVINSEGDISDDYYLPNMIKLNEGFYDIKINSVDDVFEEKIYHIYINSSQIHYLEHNQEEKDGKLQLKIDGAQDYEYWQLNEINNFDSNTWYSNNNMLTLEEKNYYINFKDITGYTKPDIKTVYISKNVQIIFQESYINNYGKCGITSSNNFSTVFFDSIEWRLKNETITTEWIKSSETFTTLNGEYNIEIKTSNDEILDHAAKINIYKEQKTLFLVNTLFGA